MNACMKMVLFFVFGAFVVMTIPYDEIESKLSLLSTGGVADRHQPIAQQQPAKEQLVGTWTLVSWEQTKADATPVQQFGENQKGIAFFDAAGRYTITVMRSDRAKYAIDNFAEIAQATAEENKATAQGTMTYFGTYSVSERDWRVELGGAPLPPGVVPAFSIAIHVEASSFPNWNGTDQKWFLALVEDQLKWTARPPSGGRVDVLWKRAK
jgi:lipocalin-like protein